MKWLDEKVLIRYWSECHSEYSLPDGRRIKSAKANPSFDAYPDISENMLDDGNVVPCEIEWLTTSFSHELSKLQETDGFLVVYQKNSEFPLPQIEISKKHFREWMKRNAETLVRETEKEFEMKKRTSLDPRCWLVYVGGVKAQKNLEIAMKDGVWGFPELPHSNESKTQYSRVRGRADILQIRRGTSLL